MVKVPLNHNIHRGCRIVWSWTLILLFSPQITQGQNTSHLYSINASREASRYRDDLKFLAVTSLSIAFLIAFIGSMFGYMAYLDNRILNKFASAAAASTVEATVISTEVAARSGTLHQDFCCAASGQVQYNVLVEYHPPGPHNGHQITVRKQVGARESDFIILPNNLNQNIKANPTEADSFLSVDSTINSSKDDQGPEVEKNTLKPKFIFNQDSFFQTYLVEERKLKMLVIEGQPKSGFSLEEHKRRTNHLYTLPTVFFLGVVSLATIFAIHMGARILFELVESEELQNGIALMIVIGFTIAILLQLPCIHFALHDIFQQMLAEEYFEDNGLKSVEDDSTLSSSSDVYLLHP